MIATVLVARSHRPGEDALEDLRLEKLDPPSCVLTSLVRIVRDEQDHPEDVRHGLVVADRVIHRARVFPERDDVGCRKRRRLVFSESRPLSRASNARAECRTTHSKRFDDWVKSHVSLT